MSALGANTGTAGLVGPGRDLNPAATGFFDRRRYLHFFVEKFGDPTSNFRFDVLAGDEAPTIVGGYAQWAPVNRPLRGDLMVFTGYSSVSMTLSLRFVIFDQDGSWRRDDNAGRANEQAIERLGWMAGHQVHTGPSPLVYPSTYDGQGSTTPLIPVDYQLFGGTPRPWIVTALEWDTAPIRNSNGYRVRQDATVTLNLFTAADGEKVDTFARAKATTVKSRPGVDSALLIARDAASPDPMKLASDIMKNAHNANLRLRFVNQKIKWGREVWIPVSKNG